MAINRHAIEGIYVQVDDKKAAKRADDEAAVLAKIAAMPAPYRAMGDRLHGIIMKGAPGLTPRVRYGMPWYFKDGKSWYFFRAATKFNFFSFGFDDPATLTSEERALHQLVASAYRIYALDEATEAKLSTIVREAAGKAAG
jgi:hypothetical protein